MSRPNANETSSTSALAAKLVLDRYGDFLVDKAKELTSDEVRLWVTQRLTGHDQVIPLAAWKSERRSDAVVDLCRAVEDIRTHVAAAVEFLVRDWLKRTWAENDPEAASELLDVIDRTQPEIRITELMAVAQRRELEGLFWDGADLHERLLLTLGSLQRQLPVSFWQEQLKAPRFARAAYLGLCQMNPCIAIGRFTDFLDIVRTEDDPVGQIEYPLFFLIDHFGPQKALAKLAKTLFVGDSTADVRHLVDKALRRIKFSLDDAREAALADPAVQEYADYVMSGKQEVRPLLEPTLLIRGADTQPRPIVLEEAFTRYNALWVLFPTIDSTSLALHCLSAVNPTRFASWLSDHRSALTRFLESCVQEDGAAISPLRHRKLSLYATLNALGVAKALADIPQNKPLVDDWDKAVRLVGAESIAALKRAALTLLHACVRQGVFVDDPKDDHPSINAIDLGVSILWNLGKAPEDVGVVEAKVFEFLEQCRVETDGGTGFKAHPDAGAEPCATSTSLVHRIPQRARWRSHSIDPKRLIRFFNSMQVVDEGLEYGGFRVFASEPATLSSTVFSVFTLLQLGATITDASKWSIHEFAQSCRRDGGYAFHPHKRFSANVHATRYAVRIYRRLMGQPLPEPDAVTRFVESQFDPDEGGFYGYERPLARNRLVDIPS